MCIIPKKRRSFTQFFFLIGNKNCKKSILEIVGFGDGIDDLVAREDAIVEEASVVVHEVGNGVSVVALAERHDVQLVVLGHVLEELATSGPKLGVIPHVALHQLIVIHVLYIRNM